MDILVAVSKILFWAIVYGIGAVVLLFVYINVRLWWNRKGE